ncbi:hypothetical protein BAXH7_03303 [Bacillus amyloliquefaciens XH7]|nr:hypothetical protein BAXH7_03303 [Bacillus amyloliquefaciens XH7]
MWQIGAHVPRWRIIWAGSIPAAPVKAGFTMKRALRNEKETM